MGILKNFFGGSSSKEDESKYEKGRNFFNQGVNCDNANDLAGAIRNYSKAIKVSNHAMAYYCRACVYKDLKRYKEAIKDFESYLKFGSKHSSEHLASEYTIKELKQKIK